MLLFGFKNQTYAQQQVVKGIVKDASGVALPGVSVAVKGTTTGVATDIDGRFAVKVGGPASTLVFTFVGFDSQSVVVGEKTDLVVVLVESSQKLNEVVVTGYGGTQIRSKLTNSIATVKKDNLESGMFSNPAQALSGAVSGVRVVQNSGNPGAAPTVILRGGTNLDGSGSPLVIVDGQIRGGLNDINTDDIESMEVLKDAGATAIYGARANNGVILVTTKKGKSGTSQISVKGKVGLNFLNVPYQFMSGGDYLYWMRTGVKNAAQMYQKADGTWVGSTNTNSLSTSGAYGTGNKYFAADGVTPLDGNMDTFAVWSPMILNDSNRFLLSQGWKSMVDPVYGDNILYYDYSWKSIAFRNPATTQDYTVSFSGGNDKGHYYSSLGYNYSNGLPINTFYRNLTGVLNADYQVRSWLISTTNINYAKANWRDAQTTTEASYFGRMLSLPPTQRLTNPNGDLLIGRGNGDENPNVNDAKFKRFNQTDKFTLGQNFRISLMDGLAIKTSASLMYEEGFNESFNQDYLTAPKTINTSRKTSASFDRTIRQTYNSFINYDKVFNSKHTVGIIAGAEYYNSYNYGLLASGSGAPTDDFGALGLTLTDANKRTIGSYHNMQRILSFIGRASYDYESKYLLQVNIRKDGYSMLINNRWGVFPGVSAGWVFTKERFLEGISKYLSFGKLRASYGVNGNVSGLEAYTLQGSYRTSRYNGNAGFAIGSIPNPDLRWERSKTFETGIDLGFLNNKVTTNLTYFDRVTDDKFAKIPLPISSGISSILSNNGKIRNSGVEFEVNVNAINTQAWKLSFAANISYIKNTILKLPDNGLERNRQGAFQVYDPKTKELIWVGGYQEGQSPDALYAYKALGIYKDNNQITQLAANLVDKSVGNNGANNKVLYGPEAWAKLTDAEKAKGFPIQPGDVIWQDVNGDGVIDQYDMVKVGNTTPRWTGGFNGTLSWKGLSLFARMDYAFGFQQYDNIRPWFMGAMQGSFNTLVDSKDTWTPENPDAKYPKYYWADQLGKRNYARQSSMFVYNASYLAFREVSLRYMLPKSIAEKIKMQGLQVSVTGQNLGYLTSSKLFSPEATGSVGSGYSLPRTVIFGIDVTF